VCGVVGLYFYSDETKVAKFGDAQVYPLHMGIANFTAEARAKKGGSNFLLAYMPWFKPMEGNRGKAYVKRRTNEVRQEAIGIVLDGLVKEQDKVKEMRCPDGKVRCASVCCTWCMHV
jgi:hypothetical protein